MLRCGLAICVPAAPALVKKHAHYVTRREGGRGAAREICEMIMEAQDTWRRNWQCTSNDQPADFRASCRSACAVGIDSALMAESVVTYALFAAGRRAWAVFPIIWPKTSPLSRWVGWDCPPYASGEKSWCIIRMTIRLIWSNPISSKPQPGKPAVQVKSDQAKISWQQRKHLFDSVTSCCCGMGARAAEKPLDHQPAASHPRRGHCQNR